MKEKENYEMLAIEIIALKVENGYAGSTIPDDMNVKSPWN